MQRALFALCWLAFMALGSCAADVEEPPIGSIREDVGGKSCITSADCPGDFLCTTEAGDCRTPARCEHGRHICPAICFGICRPLEPCGSVVCGDGQVCCNESCAICTEPDGVCIQTICEEVLPG